MERDLIFVKQLYVSEICGGNGSLQRGVIPEASWQILPYRYVGQ